MKDYYSNSFRNDLRAFIRNSSAPYFGTAWPHNSGALLSPVPSHTRAGFLICLYFTVLADQAMHAHFRSAYHRFEHLTRSPKFCHGLSQFQQNPRNILIGPVDAGVLPAEDLLELLPAGMALFVEEFAEFFRVHLPEVSADEFFDRLVSDADVQVPELLAILDPRLRHSVGYVAYQSLKMEIDRMFPGSAI